MGFLNHTHFVFGHQRQQQQGAVLTKKSDNGTGESLWPLPYTLEFNKTVHYLDR